MRHLRNICAGCNRSDISTTKEHPFPKWLILRTGTDKTGIRWGEKRHLPALAATLPLCGRCNAEFGRELEGPTAHLFDEVEGGKGLSDEEAELLIRWMWKIKGLLWHATFSFGRYTQKYSLRERVLLPIDDVRSQLVFGMALVAGLHPHSQDLPMGIDSDTAVDAIFVSGVFSRIAMMVVFAPFAHMIPRQFSKYSLAPYRARVNSGKVFYPPTTFKDDVEAVGVTIAASAQLSRAHDQLAMQMQAFYDQSV